MNNSRSTTKQSIALLCAVAIALVLMGFGTTARAAWVLIEDFQDYDLGRVRDGVTGGVWGITGDGNWSFEIREPFDDGNRMLAWGKRDQQSGRARAYRPLEPEFQLTGGTATYFTRFRADKHISTGSDIHFGLSDGGTGWGNYVGRVYFERRDGNSLNVHARDGGSDPRVGTIDLEQWYNFWLVADRDAETYSVYMNTGSVDATSADLIAEDFGFRSKNDITAIMHIDAAVWADNINMQGFTDQYWYSPGVNLTFIPEPGAWLMLLWALACGLLVRRRKHDI